MESELSLRVGGVEVTVSTVEAATSDDRRLACQAARLLMRLLGPQAPELGRIERLRMIVERLRDLNAIPDRLFRAISYDVEGIPEDEVEHWREIDPALAGEAMSAVSSIYAILYDDASLADYDADTALEERNAMRRHLSRLIEALTALEVRRGAV